MNFEAFLAILDGFLVGFSGALLLTTLPTILLCNALTRPISFQNTSSPINPIQKIPPKKKGAGRSTREAAQYVGVPYPSRVLDDTY